MRILHINSYYIDNHLYSYLYRELDSSHKQTIYVPIKWNRSPENQVDLAQGELHFSRILKKKHKFLFKVKVRSLFKDLIGRNLHENCELVHAHNLFNDGALAYELFKSYSLPFTVAVRSTDINLQYKYMVHRRGYIHMVLNSARDIIFISEVSRKKFLDMLPEGLSKSLEKKTMVIPNGIDHFWHKNTAEKAIKDIDSQEPFRFIYVGQILKRKKLELALQALKELNKEGNQFELIVIGGSNNSELEYYSEITAEFENRKDIQYLGKIKDKKKLLEDTEKLMPF
ncbi:glycosyltransferase [Aureicoccus marinus]|uniref:Glycosyl transferase family 1 domain-containing protein n=1 Tax=Aureicoccus marinus TaxID=754435 RepID=A0A2S7T5P1_9FLAO|nr:glycosyltransferase [Aureicoccus marinus]PQJ15242.1 hypothetical protein BST99_05410 [Aureicoccus marinus]